MYKKMYKKIILFVLIVVMLCSTFTVFAGCFGGDDGEKIDKTREQVYVGNFNGGLGEEWVYEAKKRYELANPKIQIIINSSKEDYKEVSIKQNFKYLNDDLFFIDYADYFDFKKNGFYADITEAVTSPLTEFGETKSIQDKMEKSFIDFYKTDEDKYYCLPFYKASYNMYYDLEIFEKYSLYLMSDDSGIWNGEFTNVVGEGTYGLDKIKGTRDDGLPASFSQFGLLLEQMVNVGVVPMIWSGDNPYYVVNWLYSVWADFEGYDNMMQNYTFEGEYTFANETKSTKISLDNGYRLQEQKGKRYAVELMAKILSNGKYFAEDSFGLTSQITTQSKFVGGKLGTPIAMLIDGTWWENEAKGAFASLYNQTGKENDKYGNRRYGLMPIPHADDGSSSNTDVIYGGNSGRSMVFMNANTPSRANAERFLRYCHTDEILSMMTAKTSVSRPYEYEITKEDEKTMTPLGKSLRDYFVSNKIVYNLPFNDFIPLHSDTYFSYLRWEMSSLIDKTEYYYPHMALWVEPKKTVDQIMQGMQDKINKQNWARDVAEYKAM